jgi:replicative DNA helicase
MQSDNVTIFKDFANQYSSFLSEHSGCFFPKPSEFMEYMNNCRGKMIVIGSRPAHGKTSLMLSLIKEAPQIPVLVFSLEYSSHQLQLRLMRISGELKLPTSLAQCAEQDNQTDRCLIHTERNLSICDKSSLTFGEFLSVIENQQLENPVSIVFIDFYQLLDDKSQNLLYKMKKCAEMFNIPIVALSQLERSIDKNPLEIPTLESFPRLNDTENVDEAYYLVRPNQYKISQDEKGNRLENTAILNCMKGKFEKRKMIFHFNEESSAFEKAKVLNF